MNSTSRRGLLGLRVLVGPCLIASIACQGGNELAGSALPPSPPPSAHPGASVVGVLLTPDSVALSPSSQQQFSASAQYNNGTFGPIPVVWGAAGGAVSAGGLYVADSTPGIFRVIAIDSVSGKADTSTIQILAANQPPPLPPPPPPLPPPPPPTNGNYVALAKQDWNTYADKAALSRLIGVEGGLNRCTTPHTYPDGHSGTACDPWLPKEAFYDLVPDLIFGKVVVYRGDPALNLEGNRAPGRVATHGVGLGTQTPPPNNPSWWKVPAGQPFADGKTYFPRNVWVRQYVKFDPNWSGRGPGGDDYKTLFLRYWGNARDEIHFGIRERGFLHTPGNPGLALLSRVNGPLHNLISIDQQYNTSGWFVSDAWPLVSAFAARPGNTPNYGPGDGEWIEIVWRHETSPDGLVLHSTCYWRQYTTGGVVAPGAWKISDNISTVVAGTGLSGTGWPGVVRYEMGVNRNGAYDRVGHINWGPYEVVDGSVYPNPWNLP